MAGLEFTMEPDTGRMGTVKPVALISLAEDITDCLTRINDKVRPIEKHLLEKRGLGFYWPQDDNEEYHTFDATREFFEKIRSFALNFENRYQEVDQVYVFPKSSSSLQITTCPEGKVKTVSTENASIKNGLEKVLGCVTNSLIYEVPLSINFSKPDYIFIAGQSSEDIRVSYDPKLSKLIEQSLKFKSW